MIAVYQKNNLEHMTIDYAILSTEYRSVVDLIGMNCAYYLLLSDLTTKTTTNNRQTSHIFYIHIHILCTKNLHFSNEENS